MRSIQRCRVLGRRVQQGAAILFAGVVSSVAAAGEKAQVPADLAAVVPNSAAVVVYMPDFGVMRTFDEMFKGNMPVPQNMPAPMTGLVETTLKPPAKQTYLGWLASFDDLMNADSPEEAPFHVAFLLPGATADSVKPLDGHEIVSIDGDVVVVGVNSSTKPGGKPGEKPATGDNPLLAHLGVEDIAFAVDGKQIAAQVQQVAPMVSMVPFMMQQALSEQMQGLSDADKAAATKAQQSSMKDVSTVLNGLVAGLQDIDVMSGGVRIAKELLGIELDFELGSEVPGEHGVSPAVLKALPDDMIMYYAMDAATIAWLAQLEFDFLGAYFAKNADQIKRFDAVTSAVKKIVGNVDGGYAGATDTAFQEVKTVVGVADAKAFVSDLDAMCESLTGLEMGLAYEKKSTSDWRLTLDPQQMMKGFGMGDAGAIPDEQRLAGTYDISVETDGDLVMLDQRKEGSKGASFKGGAALRSALSEQGDTRIIVGMAFDLLQILQQQGTELPRGIEQYSGLTSLVLHSPNPKTLAASIQFPWESMLMAPIMAEAQMEEQKDGGDRN